MLVRKEVGATPDKQCGPRNRSKQLRCCGNRRGHQDPLIADLKRQTVNAQSRTGRDGLVVFDIS